MGSRVRHPTETEAGAVRLTERLRVRPMTRVDLPAFARWMAPGAPHHALDGPYYPKASVEQIAALVEKMERWIDAGHLPDPFRRYAIADRESDALIGTLTRYWISEETHWPALGLVFYEPARWGRGLGREALSVWCDLVFETHPDVVRLDLRTWSGNAGMMGLASRLGFQLEARFRKARVVDGKHYDGLGYGILREEWDAR